MKKIFLSIFVIAFCTPSYAMLQCASIANSRRSLLAIGVLAGAVTVAGTYKYLKPNEDKSLAAQRASERAMSIEDALPLPPDLQKLCIEYDNENALTFADLAKMTAMLPRKDRVEFGYVLEITDYSRSPSVISKTYAAIQASDTWDSFVKKMHQACGIPLNTQFFKSDGILGSPNTQINSIKELAGGKWKLTLARDGAVFEDYERRVYYQARSH